MRFLVVTAVVAERDAAVARLGAQVHQTRLGPYDAVVAAVGAGQVTAVAGGVGPSAAAAVTATALTLGTYDVVVNLGVAGAFRGGGATATGVVVADAIVAADLGAWAPDGFLDLTAIGLDGAGGVAPPKVWVDHAVETLYGAGLPCLSGAVLTLSAMTGTDARAEELFARHGAVAEAMEAAGAAEAAGRYGLPIMEIRTISNAVGDRDREIWQLAPALERLTSAATVLFAKPWPELG